MLGSRLEAIRLYPSPHRSGVTLNGWPKELLGRGEDTGQHQVHGGAFVEQLEAPVIDGDLVNFQEVTRDFCHGAN